MSNKNQNTPTFVLAACLVMAALAPTANADDVPAEERKTPSYDAILEEDTSAKLQKDNFVIVPIPMSSPTFGSGLIVGGAYFYPQTEAQKSAQPASFTGAAAGYTHNESWVVGAGHQSYWNEDTWRMTVVAGLLDFKLELIAPDDVEEDGVALDWLVSGGFFQTDFSRRIGGDWFAGVTLRYLDIEQDLDLRNVDPGIEFDANIRAAGVGLSLSYDTRDLPANAYNGELLELRAMTNTQSPGDRSSYQSYKARLRAYRQVASPLVIAGDVSLCRKTGEFPLWDTCRLPLRGFPITRYLGDTSIYGQVEARWKLSKRWGVTAFAGAGDLRGSLTRPPEDSVVTSYGGGVRFMVMQSQRINVRVDYARSNNGSDAWYLSVAEAF